MVLTGPRRAGKTMLLLRLFPEASYFLLEDTDIVARLRADLQGFLDAVPTPAILDEVQNVPEVFGYVRARIDRRPRRAGQWLLTGSQESALMRGAAVDGGARRAFRPDQRSGAARLRLGGRDGARAAWVGEA